MLDYWCEVKISTVIDSKTNPKNEILWDDRKTIVGKKCFSVKLVWHRHYKAK